MKKGEHYEILSKAGLPVPIYGVFDSSCLTDVHARADLHRCVDRILASCGLVGVRTEPINDPSPLGNYPHYMPLRTFEEVTAAIRRNEREQSDNRWWYLVNEAFLEYEWNAVLKLTQDGSLPGHWQLAGEINVTDNLPLRPAFENTSHLIRARDWKGTDPAQIRKRLLRAGLVETWIEASKVRIREGTRLVFWGLRGIGPKKPPA